MAAPKTREDRAFDRGQLLDVLASVSELFPDQRIGQLIVNALPVKCENDAFYIEDKDLRDRLLQYANANHRKKIE